MSAGCYVMKRAKSDNGFILSTQVQRDLIEGRQAATNGSADRYQNDVFGGPFVARDGGEDGAGPSSPAQDMLTAAEQQQTAKRKGKVVERPDQPCIKCGNAGELTTI